MIAYALVKGPSPGFVANPEGAGAPRGQGTERAGDAVRVSAIRRVRQARRRGRRRAEGLLSDPDRTRRHRSRHGHDQAGGGRSSQDPEPGSGRHRPGTAPRAGRGRQGRAVRHVRRRQGTCPRDGRADTRGGTPQFNTAMVVWGSAASTRTIASGGREAAQALRRPGRSGPPLAERHPPTIFPCGLPVRRAMPVRSRALEEGKCRSTSASAHVS